MSIQELDKLHAQIKGKKVLYIIPGCAGKKKFSTQNQNHNQLRKAPIGRIHRELYNAQKSHLIPLLYRARQDCHWLACRGRLSSTALALNNSIVSSGREFNPTNTGTAHYRKAYDRYNGNLYSGAVKNLLKTKHNILIQSPLWGLLSPNDYIQNYNLRMDKREVTPKWEKLLPQIIDAFAVLHDIEMIIGLFSETSRDSKKIFPELKNQSGGYSLYLVHTIPHPDKNDQNWVPEGLGHALLYLAQGTPPPKEFDYMAKKIRP